jgi:hypothetical protein
MDEGEPMSLRRAMEELEKKPCTCTCCDLCGGTGNIRVDHFTGLPSRGCDDMDELETCDQCSGGVLETCERCLEMQELYEAMQDEEYHSSRQGIP